MPHLLFPCCARWPVALNPSWSVEATGLDVYVNSSTRTRNLVGALTSTLTGALTKLYQGMNENGGERIHLRLRSSLDHSAFLDFEEVVGTMLHEYVY